MPLAALLCLTIAAMPPKLSADSTPTISPDGKRIFSTDGKGSIGVYDARTLDLITEWKKAVPTGNRYLYPSRSGKFLLVLGQAGVEPTLHDATNGKLRCAFKGGTTLSGGWFSETEDQLFSFGERTPAEKKLGWAFFTWAVADCKLVAAEPMAGAMSTPEHPSTGRALGARGGEEILFSTSGSRLSLGKGTYGCVASSPNLVVYQWRKSFMENQVEPLMWLDPAHPDERHALAQIAKCDNAYLDGTGTRLLVRTGSVLRLWDLSDRANPKQLGDGASCQLVQGIAPDLSFALCSSASSVARVNLGP